MMSLLKTQLWVSLNINAFLRGKRRGRYLLILVGLIIAFSPSYGGLVWAQYSLFDSMAKSNLPLYDLVVSGMYIACQMMILFIGFPIIYSTLFQSNDMAMLLPLPYKPTQLIIAKLTVLYVLELLVSLLLFLPSFILNIMFGHPDGLTIVNGLLSALLLPVVPLSVTAILSMLIMNIPKLGKNQWFWYLFIMIAVLGATMSMLFLLPSDKVNVTSLIQAKMQQLNEIGKYVPGSIFALRTFTETGLLALGNQLLNLLSTAIYLAVLLTASTRLFFAPLTRGIGNASRVKRGKVVQSSLSSFRSSYIRKEIACVLKEPSVALNALGGYVSMPIVVIMWTVLKIQSSGKVDPLGKMLTAIHSPQFATYYPLIVIGIGLFLAFLGTGSLFSASYSKDGKRLWIEKCLPVDRYAIFEGKMLANVLMVSILNVLSILVLAFILPLNPVDWLVVLVISELLIVFNGVGALIFDCRRPKVDWINIIQAVKQNFNIVFSFAFVLLSFVVNGGVLYLAYQNHWSNSAIYALALLLNAVLVIVVMYLGRRNADALDRVQV